MIPVPASPVVPGLQKALRNEYTRIVEKGAKDMWAKGFRCPLQLPSFPDCLGGRDRSKKGEAIAVAVNELLRADWQVHPRNKPDFFHHAGGDGCEQKLKHTGIPTI